MRVWLGLWVALLVVTASAGPPAGPPAGAASARAPHVGSYSLSEIHIRQSTVQLQFRCQVLSLGEVIEPFDPDLDGNMDPGELEANSDAIVDYLATHYRLVAGASDDAAASDAGRALSVTSSVVVEAPAALDPLNEVSQWIDVVLDYESVELSELGSLGVHVETFYVTSPQHRDSAAVVWNGVELAAWQFAQGAEAHVFVPTEEMLARNVHPVIRYIQVGAGRVLGAWDALLLVLLFVLAARGESRRSAMTSVALFLGVASVTMLGAPNVHLLPQHVRFLELTVPLALAYVGLDDLLHNRGRTRVLETCVFGLALGGREATRLAPELSREAASQAPMLGFGLGFSGVLLGMALVSTWVAREQPAEDPAEESAQPAAFAWRALRVPVALVSISVGLWLFWGVFRA